jgi:hypothetical protein
MRGRLRVTSHNTVFVAPCVCPNPAFGGTSQTPKTITKMPLRLNAFGVHILANGWRMSERLQPKNNTDILLAIGSSLAKRHFG